MEKSFKKMLHGYQSFREKYAQGDNSIMHYLSHYGQHPKIMVVACCDSRVDPALILQCDPGDLFVVRNVANLVPPYEPDHGHHGTSAALEFGICFLKVKHLILLGHSQCGGIQILLDNNHSVRNDFITDWVSLIKTDHFNFQDAEHCAKAALNQSLQNCLTFPWIQDKVQRQELKIHLWYFDVGKGQIFSGSPQAGEYQPLELVEC